MSATKVRVTDVWEGHSRKSSRSSASDHRPRWRFSVTTLDADDNPAVAEQVVLEEGASYEDARARWQATVEALVDRGFDVWCVD